jgi:NhaP-type Na+/H+ or K+/H+ antiporter
MIYYWLLGVSVLTVVSFAFNRISSKIRIPSVLLLMGLGVVIQFVSHLYMDNTEVLVASSLKVLGTLGLIFIVLEGALDLSLSKEKLGVAGKAFAAAIVIFSITAALAAGLFLWLMDISLQSALAYAIPLSIISSAIAIPSTLHLKADTREFVVYESIFCDIIGILAFKYVILPNPSVLGIAQHFATDVLVIVPVTALFLIATLVFLQFSNAAVKWIPLLAIITAVYAVTMIFHLPALLLILAFGVTLKNRTLFSKKIGAVFNMRKLDRATYELKIFVSELSFLIRTFFFIVFGFTLPLKSFLNPQGLAMGAAVFLVIGTVRFVSLRYILKTNFLQELLIAPRGLVTVILFFSIPLQLQHHAFSNDIIYFVIIASSLVMMVSFVFYKKPYKEYVVKVKRRF